MLDLAQENVIDRARHPRFAGRLEGTTHAADGANQSCGDEVRMELHVVDGIIRQVRHVVRGCTVCAAAADLLAERLEGEPADTVLSADDIAGLLDIPLSPTRLKCALLPLETLRLAIDKNAVS